MDSAHISWTEALKARGLSGLSRFMAIFSFFAAAIVTITAITLFGASFLVLRTEPLHQSWGSGKRGVEVNASGFAAADLKVTDSACVADVIRKGGNDTSGCPLIPATPEQIAALKKASSSSLAKFYRLSSTWINLVPAAVLAFGLFQAGFCFSQLAAGKYFAPKTVRYLRNFAFAGLFFVVVSPLVPFIYTAVTNTISAINLHFFTSGPGANISLPGPYSPPRFAVGSHTNFASFLTAIYAFTLAIIAALMTKASAIAEDNAQII